MSVLSKLCVATYYWVAYTVARWYVIAKLGAMFDISCLQFHKLYYRAEVLKLGP